MPTINGQRLWNIKTVSVPGTESEGGNRITVEHGLTAVAMDAIKAQNIWVIPVPPIPCWPGWSAIDIQSITRTEITFSNSYEEDIRISFLVVTPHTMMGPGNNENIGRVDGPCNFVNENNH